MKAFSLVELSIVLVILGLLTGGILTGQSLIKAAELRAVTTEHEQYITAANMFRSKYFALPGDMINATDFWTTNTANGNGNGIFEDPASGGNYGEKLLFWQHLALAGLIEGIYTGRAGTADVKEVIIGQNAPRSKFPNAGWAASYWILNPGGNDSFEITFNHYLMFGANNAGAQPTTAVLTPQEMWNIDKKIDDGLPAHGKIIANHWNDLCSKAVNNLHANDNLDAIYKLEDENIRCSFVHINIF